ncbi:H-NS family nucleoid-associated regulatory protein [Pararhodobacter sp. CCB-MM2]|uniref:H-NS histone family protein n=1 Tax=Pararhodobacter sp. CCB-MM2 TaxID=1786003 RepID=UPI00082B59A9|nr:H-NS histone family protein [Pararhodobacter sp. CCB-MM2]
MVNLEGMSLKELKQLQKDVDAAIVDFKDRERRQAVAEVEAFARERGISLSDLSELSGKRKRKRKPAAPKYANPADQEQTWTGRGRRPRWVEAALNEGKSLEDLAI